MTKNYLARKSVLFLLFVSVVCSAQAYLIPAPDRIDMAYDDIREVLYISNGGALLRYSLITQEFLPAIEIGGRLMGMDISPDGESLAVANMQYEGENLYVHIVDLSAVSFETIPFQRESYEGGSFTVAYGNDGALLISSTFLGSGWVPLRKYDPATGAVVTLASIRQNSMLRASADGSVIAFAESNISDGRFGRYRIADGDVLRRQWYDHGTSAFNYEIAVNHIGDQYAIPTYYGCKIYDESLLITDTLGMYAGMHPMGLVYHPFENIVYFAWTDTTTVVAHDTHTFEVIEEFNVGARFNSPGNRAFVEGRLKISRDGSKVFCSVDGGVECIVVHETNTAPVAEDQSILSYEDQPVAITVITYDAEDDPLSYTLLEEPRHGTLSGTYPDFGYTPNYDYNGADSFVYQVNDGMLDSEPATVDIQVLPVNDAPVISLSAEELTMVKRTTLNIPGFVTFSPGALNESSQQLSFEVSVDNPGLFSIQPTINDAGTLTLSAGPRKGTAMLSVYAIDDGGNENGGVDRSEIHTVTVRLLPRGHYNRTMRGSSHSKRTTRRLSR